MGAAAGDASRLTPDSLLRALAADAPLGARSVAVVVAHPDDEVIGVGGRLPPLTQVSIVHVTDGAPRSMHDAHAAGYDTREAYAQARRREAEAALSLAGISPEQVLRLEIADQEASLRMADLARRLARFFRDGSIQVVLTHPYEGGHPDHDATSFAVHYAAALMRRARGAGPAILEMAGYHAGPDGVMEHDFLPNGGRGLTVELDPAEQALKRRMLACHTTQSRTLAQFGVAVERYRLAPRYDFTSPPHPGRLWYEQFHGGMTGVQWRMLAAQALAELRR